MSDERARRLADNEDVFRQVNDAIARGRWPHWAGGEESRVSFRCECGRLGCNRLLTLTLPEYEDLRADPRRFVMVAGHQIPEVERIVERRGGLVIVQKVGEAGEEAAIDDRE